MGKIKIKGMAKKEFLANVMKVDISISTDGETPASAINKGRKETENMLKLLHNLGIELTDVSMESEEVSKPQNYNDDNMYHYDKSIAFVTTANLATLELLAGGISESEINATYDEMFYLANIAEAKDEVLQQALQDAKKKAEILAKTLGQKVVGLESAKCDEYEEEEFEHMVHCLREGKIKTSLASELSPDTIVVDKSVYTTWIIE